MDKKLEINGDTKKEIRAKERVRNKHTSIVNINVQGKGYTASIDKRNNEPWCEDCLPALEDVIEAEINTPAERKIVDFKLLDVHYYSFYCHCNGYNEKEVACYIKYGFQGWQMK